MKKFLLLTIMVAGSFIATAQTGYVNSQALTIDLKEFVDASQKMKDKKEKLDKDLSEKQQKVQASAQRLEYEAQAPDVTEERRQQIQTQYQALQAEVNNAITLAKAEMLGDEKKLLEPIFEKVNKAIETVAKRKGYKLVIDAATSTLVYADPEFDLTNEVRKELGLKELTQ